LAKCLKITKFFYRDRLESWNDSLLQINTNPYNEKENHIQNVDKRLLRRYQAIYLQHLLMEEQNTLLAYNFVNNFRLHRGFHSYARLRFL